MNEQITSSTCINKIRAMRNLVLNDEELRHRTCTSPCEDYKPVKQFTGERFGYLRLYQEQREGFMEEL